MKRLYYSLIVIVVCTMSSFAQPNRGGVHHGMSRCEMNEAFKSQRVAFLSSYLALTSNEAEKFWPIFNEFDKKLNGLHVEKRNMLREYKTSDKVYTPDEVIKMTQDISGLEYKEGAIKKEYNEKFLKVLPPEKVLKFYMADGDFKRYMMRKYRDGFHPEGKPMPED